ncbi:uncharacterized protein [Aegilops tauschii subsp. strangulata]|uniref:uncharacterized protein n=1 Tax=Aegilops tauschii subsp. strangulata TaxID=200361 RepID=UPI003CC86191
MHFDGSKMRLSLGAGIVLSSPKGDRLKYALRIHFTASNNIAEYEALMHGLRLAKELGIPRILCYGDSDLVVQQCSGEWDARDPNMASHRFLGQKLSEFFAGCEFLHVPRVENEAADTLAKIGSSRQAIPFGVSLEHLRKPSVKPSSDSESIYVPDDPATPQPGTGTAEPDPGAAAPEPAMVAVFAMVTTPSWALPISEFLENGVLPMDETEARIITDNGTNFAKGALAQYCFVSGIRLDLASVAHPQSNGQPRLVELLIRSPGSWLDELPAVLWSLRTTPNRSTGFTPFILVYGAEAVIPTDVEFDSPRVTMYTKVEAKEAREDGVDLLEEARLLALSRSAIYQQGLRHYHSKKIMPLAFREGDLVLRLVQKQTGQHKLSSPWEGPFIVSKALCDRNAYYLIDARKSNKRKRDTAYEETIRPWNAELLRPFYS